MEAFEQIIGQLLEEDKFWVRHELKVILTEDEKKQIGKDTIPAIGIDIVAMDVVNNTIYLLEVKNFLNSNGVDSKKIMVEYEKQEGRYKFLTCTHYRNIITERLRKQLQESGHIKDKITISYGLIVSAVAPKHEILLDKYFKDKGWFFWGQTIVRDKIKKLADNKYENKVATVVSKILFPITKEYIVSKEK